MRTDIQEIQNKAMPILKKAGVIHSSIFGSVVRGETGKNSDIDVLVDLPEDKTLFDFIDLQHKLEQALDRKVDLGEFSTIKPRLRENILKSAIQIL